MVNNPLNDDSHQETSSESQSESLRKERLPALDGFQADVIVKEVKEVKEAVEQIRQVRSIYSKYLTLTACAFLGTSIFLFSSFGILVLRASESIINNEMPFNEILKTYLVYYSPALSLAITSIICTIIGYFLLGQAGALVRTVIPREDQEFLKSLKYQDEKSVEHYIRLTSLTGLTGFFTKIGITGLPLATIALTIIFGALALFFDGAEGSSRFFDFANLTLGAFLGSYVQKHAPNIDIKKEDR